MLEIQNLSLHASRRPILEASLAFTGRFSFKSLISERNMITPKSDMVAIRRPTGNTTIKCLLVKAYFLTGINTDPVWLLMLTHLTVSPPPPSDGFVLNLQSSTDALKKRRASAAHHKESKVTKSLQAWGSFPCYCLPLVACLLFVAWGWLPFLVVWLFVVCFWSSVPPVLLLSERRKK